MLNSHPNGTNKIQHLFQISKALHIILAVNVENDDRLYNYFVKLFLPNNNNNNNETVHVYTFTHTVICAHTGKKIIWLTTCGI